MNQITGKLLFIESNITVHECADGYIISNGVDVCVVGFMPLLDADSLKKIFITDCNYERFQLARHGNVIKSYGDDEQESRSAFDIWFSKESELLEMHSMGY